MINEWTSIIYKNACSSTTDTCGEHICDASLCRWNHFGLEDIYWYEAGQQRLGKEIKHQECLVSAEQKFGAQPQTHKHFPLTQERG